MDFDEPDALFGITSDDLKSVGLRIPLAMKLSNKLPQQNASLQAAFRSLLRECGIDIDEEVMKIIVKHFASRVALVDSAEEAKDLYLEAAMLPRSATKIALQEQDISVAELFRGSDPSKAILLHAHERGDPRILKIGTQGNTQHELQVWNAIATSTDQGQRSHLVPIRELKFQSAAIVHVGNSFGGSSAEPPVRGGILMKHYQGTLAQCKIPLTEEVLLRYGGYLKEAVSAMHIAGFCHLDIKPSNVFLFEKECFLGDYGASARTGEPIRERTTKYYPKDGDFEAKEETDMYLLAMTLMEMFGTIPPASQRQNALTKAEILRAVRAERNENVRNLLLSVFDNH